MTGIGELSLLGFYTLGCLGLGLVALHTLGWTPRRHDPISPVAMLASGLILGQGVLSLFFTLMGLLALLKAWVIWPSLALGVLGGGLLAWRLAFPALRQLKGVWNDLTSDDWGWRLIPLFLASLIAIHAAACIVPLSGSDAAVIYMSEGRLIAATARIMPIPNMELTLKYGLVGELHYAAFMALGTGSQTPRLFVLALIIAAGIVFAALGRTAGMGRRGQWILACILFTSSVATNVISDGKVDLFAAVLGMAAFFWASQHVEDERCDQALQRIAVVLASLAVVAKPTYIVSLVVPLVVFIAWRRLTFRPVRTFRDALVLLAPLMIRLGIWLFIPQVPNLLKNAVLFQEPLAPFLGPTGSYYLSQRWLSTDNVYRLLLVYPLALVFADYPSPLSQYGRLSFAVLAFAPLGLLMPRCRPMRGNILFQLSAVGIFGIVLWTAVFPAIFVPRYFMATLFLLALFPARAAEYASTSLPRRLRLNLLVLLVLWFASYCSIKALTGSYYPLNVIGKELPSYVLQFLNHNDLGHCDKVQHYFCPPLEALSQHADPGTRILMLGAPNPYTFGLRPDLIQCLESSTDPRIGKDVLANWRMLIQRGYSYLQLPKDGVAIEALGIPDLVPSWITLERVYEGRYQSIYRLSSTLPDVNPEWACKQTAPGVWSVLRFSPAASRKTPTGS